MLLRLIQSLDQDRFKSTIMSQKEDELCRRAQAEGINVEIVPFQGILDSYGGQLLSQSPLVLLPTIVRVCQFNVEAHNCFKDADVIWCKNLRAVLTILPNIALTDRPVIWNIGLGLKSEGIVRHLNSIALRAVDHVFIESEIQAKRVFTETQFDRHKDKFTIFNKGINVDQFSPPQDSVRLDGEVIHVGTASTLTPRKGIEYFIDAAIEILNRRSDVCFHVAGEPVTESDEEYVQFIKERIHDAGVSDSISFHGWINDMPTFLDSLDVFVLPSLNEGVPGAPREALAMEVPVIATDVGGTGDVVKDGKTGLLISPKAPDETASSIEFLIENPKVARGMGQKGRQLIEEDFSIESYVRNYEDFLRQVGEE